DRHRRLEPRESERDPGAGARVARRARSGGAGALPPHRGRGGGPRTWRPRPMKGVVLAGGLGTRLHPLTRVTNKHLLPVYDRPMIYYPIQALVNAGIEEIQIVTGGHTAGDFLRLLANGKDFGMRGLNYAYQEGEGGIADALQLAEAFSDGEPICVILGD